MLAESLKGKLAYCLGRRIPVVHILRFPAPETMIHLCLSVLRHCLVCVNIYGMKGMTKKKKKNVSQVGKGTFLHCEHETSPES